MRNYYRIILGQKNKYAKEAFEGHFIGVDFGVNVDLKQYLSNRNDFNHEVIPLILKNSPGKSKISAGLGSGSLWTVASGLQLDDIVLCRDVEGNYNIGGVVGGYEYHTNQILPHRRSIHWLKQSLPRDEMSDALRNSCGSIAAVCNVSKHASEIEALIAGVRANPITTTDETIESPSEFALEKHLEDFLIQNWKSTELGQHYDIYQDGDIVGQQFECDTGHIDILAISKDKKTIAVVELKKGRASDVVVGQVQRYMGFVKEELAEDNQFVRGIIIAFEDDKRIKRALAVASNIEFYTYKINFKLEKK